MATLPSRYLVTGVNEILELRFSDGSRLRCTPNHRVWTANRGLGARERTDAGRQDRAIASSTRRGSPQTGVFQQGALAAARAVQSRQGDRSCRRSGIEEFAHYLGWLIGDGCVTDRNAVTVYGTEAERDEVMTRHEELLARITGFDAKPSVQANGTQQLRVTRKAFVAFVRALGASSAKAAHKRVPDAIFEAPEEALTGFLQGLFDADGCVVSSSRTVPGMSVWAASPKTCCSIFTSCWHRRGSGPASTRCRRRSTNSVIPRKDGSAVMYGSDGPSYDLRITGRSMRLFAARIGFSLPYKALKLAQLSVSTFFLQERRDRAADEPGEPRFRDNL